MGEKILVTGASGFIGSHLVEFLLEEGESVKNIRLFIAKGESLKNLPKIDFDIIFGDIRKKEDLKRAMEGVSVVYHLAAKTIEGGKYYTDSEYKEVNIQGTKNILEQCKKKKIKKFVLFSSIAVYGLPAWVGDMKNISEAHPKNPVEIYGFSKLMAEKAVIEAHKKWGIPYVIIRPTSVYGPRDIRNLLELYKIIKKHLFFFIGDGKNKMDYVYVGDVVRGARLAELSKDKTGEYIIGGGERTSLEDVVKNVSRSIDSWYFNFHLDRQFGLVLSYLMVFIFKLLGKRSPLFPERVKVLTADCFFNISKAKKELKYSPLVSFEEGTNITGRWLKENHLI